MNVFCNWRNVYLMTTIILSMANGAEAQANWNENCIKPGAAG